jgi:chorismate dehydratase
MEIDRSTIDIPHSPFSIRRSSFHNPAVPRILGAVPYLNARPLTAAIPPEFEVREAPPAALAERFRSGEFEAALLPIVEAFRLPGARIVPGAAIGARGDVLSVRVFLSVPWADARDVALDPHSVTSNALFAVLDRIAWKRGFRNAAGADGRLVIGDDALRRLGTGREERDLAGEWLAATGLPFVFAAWVTREPRPGLGDALRAAAAAGLARRDALADAAAAKLGLDPALCRRYLREHVRFELDADAVAGAELFWSHAAALGLAPPAGPLPLE